MLDITVKFTDCSKLTMVTLNKHPIIQLCQDLLFSASEPIDRTKEQQIELLEDINLAILELNKLNQITEFVSHIEILELLNEEDIDFLQVNKLTKKHENILERRTTALNEMRDLQNSTIKKLSRPPIPELILTDTDIVSNQ